MKFKVDSLCKTNRGWFDKAIGKLLHYYIWRAQFKKDLTPLFVKIEFLVPMCNVTPLLSCNRIQIT